MNTDKALANSRISSEMQGGGDTGKGMVEHGSFSVEIHSQYARIGYQQAHNQSFRWNRYALQSFVCGLMSVDVTLITQ
ncbi:MAG: hypothetical protein ACTSUO_09790 [Candidatus Thorarchaeota archaeon]